MMVEKREDGRRSYRGGVAEEQRSELERRAEELGIEDLYWTVIQLGGRVDDLEKELERASQAR